jgi:hypothetical protein
VDRKLDGWAKRWPLAPPDRVTSIFDWDMTTLDDPVRAALIVLDSAGL